MIIIRITSPYFCAGVIYGDGKVTKIAPIIKYMRKWNFNSIIEYCWKKKWNLEWWVATPTKTP
jgi:hypothetical protein